MQNECSGSEGSFATLTAVFDAAQLQQLFGPECATMAPNYSYPEAEFYECIRNDDSEKLSRLLQRRKSLSLETIRHVITEAIEKPSYDCFLELSRNPTTRDILLSEFSTIKEKPILLWAVYSRRINLVKTLVEAGAKVDTVSRLYTGPKTPLHAAISLNFPQATTYIIHKLSSVTYSRRDGGVNRRFWPEHARDLSRKWPLRVETVLATAIRLGQACTTNLLLNSGADPNVTDAAGTDMMSLCWSCFSSKRDLEKLRDYTSIAILLLEHGWGRCYSFNQEGSAGSFNSAAMRVMDSILEESSPYRTETTVAQSRIALSDISNRLPTSTSRKRSRNLDEDSFKSKARYQFNSEVRKEFSWQRRRQLVHLRAAAGAT
eukprot:gb/GECG01005794.1/.p1 GENE.gb/GECG01005794.1/~~gb/GECG01005794.1/.p1  ORF type:complete len:375 (+),score=33.92 gb/GECG01005794.1/:1-1125(+)